MPKYSVSNSCSYETAALAEPLAVVIHASHRANFLPGSAPRVCVIGSGAVGLLACSLSIGLGATSVTAIDIDETKLKFARNIVGVTNTWQVPMLKPAANRDEAIERSKDFARQALEDIGMDGFDIVFECTGVESCIQMAIFVRPMSRLSTSSLIAFHSDGSTGFQSCSGWNGHTDRIFTPLIVSASRSRPYWCVPIRKLLPGGTPFVGIRQASGSIEDGYTAVPSAYIPDSNVVQF